MKKIRMLIACMFLLTFSLTACQGSVPGPVLAVESSDYPALTQLKGCSVDTLTSAYVDGLKQKEQNAENPFATETLYPAYVRITNGAQRRLEICRKDPCGATVTRDVYNGCFVGFRNERDGGGIFYRSDPVDGVPAPSMDYVLPDRCVAIFPAPHPFHYVVTAWNGDTASTGYGTSLWLLTPPINGEDRCQAKKLMSIAMESTVVAAVMGVTDRLYVLTETGLYDIDLGTWGQGEDGVSSDPDPATMTCTPIELPSEAHRLGFNSLAYHNAHLYVGSTHGVLEYDLDDESFTWFPMEGWAM